MTGLWDERYARPGYYYGETPNDFLVDVETRFPRGARVLSIGEGEGRNAVFLAARGHSVLAVDGSATGLEKAKALAAQRRVSISTVVADLVDFDPGGACWDVVVSIWVHLPAALRRLVLGRCVAALRPAGLFVLEAYRPEQITRGTGGPPDPALLCGLEELRNDLAGLEFEHALETLRPVNEGAAHSGVSAVVQVVGRKPSAAADDHGCDIEQSEC